MANPIKLNTTVSIVDFLKSQNKPSDFTSRNTLFRESGLESRLGRYVGSADQNIALLKTARSSALPTAKTPEALAANIQTVARSLATASQERGVALTPGFKAQFPSALSSQSSPGSPAFAGGVAGISALSPELPEELKKKQGEAAEEAPISATDALATIGMPKIPTADELSEQVFGSSRFKLFQEKQELAGLEAGRLATEEKLGLEQKFGAQKKELEESLGRRGLFMSGIREGGVQDLIENLAASKLNVDRELVSKALSRDVATRERIIEDVSDLIKEAQNGRKEALSALEKVGFTVIGDKVVPTLEAKRFALSEERATAAELRAEETARRADERLEISRQNLAISKQRLGLVGQFLSGQVADQAYDALVTDARQSIQESIGRDGYIDPYIMEKFRNEVLKNMPAKLSDFDREFVPRMNPADREKFGRNIPGKGSTSEIVNQAFQDLLRQNVLLEGELVE